jgi:hypothetical protein
MKALSISQLNSVGEGLLAANRVSDFRDLEIIECTPTGETLFLMVDGPWEEIQRFHETVKELKPRREKVFELLKPQVLAAHLSLESAQVKKKLYILESDFVGHLFEAIDKMLDQGAECVDLRMARGASQNSYALMTCDEEIESVGSFHGRKIRVTLVREVSEALRSFLDFRPSKV